MIDKLIKSLKEVFKGSKEDTMRWLATKGYETWAQVEKLDAQTLHNLLIDLDKMKGREYITWQDGAYTYSRPKDIKNVSELRWKIRGLKL